MTTDTHPSGEHVCVCSADCTEVFRADTITDLAQQVARHYNREHSQELRHNYDVFDRETRGGHHVQDNIYQVRRIDYRVTAYDVIAAGRRQPLDEAFATPDDPRTCTDCWRYTGTSEVGAVELESADAWGCEWRCEHCASEKTIKEKQEHNEQLDAFAGDGGAE